MNKRFNTTGPCNPVKHYMVNIDNKINIIEDMINRGDYFVINRPRQYGKTTILSQIYSRYSNKYIVIRISFEGIGDLIFEKEDLFCSEILSIFADSLELHYEELSNKLRTLGSNLKTLNEVSRAITKFIKDLNRKAILLIDEVDKASNNQLFLSFLGMLRNKYILSNDNMDYTFHSIILAGLHDVKSLKLKLRPEEEKKYNSPWNIAVNFDVDMSFNAPEIETMLIEYCTENNILMDTAILSEKIYFYTSGYPFLVSRLCQIIDENLLETKRSWTLKDLDKSLNLILKESNTLFESLIKNIENDNELYNLVYSLAIDGDLVSYNVLNPLINLGSTYGIFKNKDNRVALDNKIYEQLIYNYLSSKIETSEKSMNLYNFKDKFITPENGLDFEKILLKYQQFMKEQYSYKDSKFIEREGRLLFLAFIKPIINGIGFDFKEVQISEEKRLDVVITYNNYKYVIELKIWRGEEYHKKGIHQLSSYLDSQSLNTGYLIIYNFNKDKEFKVDSIVENDKTIFMVWV